MGRVRWIYFLAAAVPALAPLILILRFGVDFHYFDEWMPDMAGVLIKAHSHALTLGDILAQHNEHRPAVMRLIWLAITPITHWNNVQNLTVGWGVVVGTSLLIWGLVRRTQSRGAAIFIWFLCNLLIFTPGQHENWLWGMGLADFTPGFFVMAVFLAARSKVSIWGRMAGCLILAALATFSVGNGMLAWPLGGLLLVWPEAGRKKKFVALVWLLAWGTVLLVYYHGYRSPSFGSNPYVRTFSGISLWTLAFVGSCFPHVDDVRGAMDRIIEGAVVCAGVFAAGVYFLNRLRAGRREIYERMLPWVVVAGYGIFSGLSAAFFRAGFGPDQAVSSRYVTFAVYVPIGLVNLVAIVAGEARWRGAAIAGAVVLIVSQVAVYPRAIVDCAERAEMYREGKGALLLLDIVPNDPESAYFGPFWPEKMVETANEINELGYVQPGMIGSDHAALIARQNSGDLREVSGTIDGFVARPGGEMYARGWAIFPRMGRAVSSVFLTYLDDQGRPIIFGAARVRFRRDDLAGKLPAGDFRDCGWEAYLDPHKIPASIHSTMLEAWALDTETGFATPLDHTVMIQR
jgi:hypothetical protein